MERIRTISRPPGRPRVRSGNFPDNHTPRKHAIIVSKLSRERLLIFQRKTDDVLQLQFVVSCVIWLLWWIFIRYLHFSNLPGRGFIPKMSTSSEDGYGSARAQSSQVWVFPIGASHPQLFQQNAQSHCQNPLGGQIDADENRHFLGLYGFLVFFGKFNVVGKPTRAIKHQTSHQQSGRSPKVVAPFFCY